LNTVEGGCQAKVYKFNNRKDDAVFNKDNRDGHESSIWTVRGWM